jgi:hypothetical protein
MSAIEFLKEDHATLARMIDEIVASPDVRTRAKLLERLAGALEMHGQLEEELFYPCLAGLSGLVPEARREHAQMSTLAASIDRRHPASPDFLLKIGDLRGAMQRIFVEAERLGSDELAAIGGRLEQRRQELMALSAADPRRASVA